MKILTTLNFLTLYFENLLVISIHMINCISVSCGPISYIVSSSFSFGVSHDCPWSAVVFSRCTQRTPRPLPTTDQLHISTVPTAHLVILYEPGSFWQYIRVWWFAAVFHILLLRFASFYTFYAINHLFECF